MVAPKALALLDRVGMAGQADRHCAVLAYYVSGTATRIDGGYGIAN